MHLLTRTVTAPIALLLIFAQCGSKGPVSPDEAFSRLQSAYKKSDAKAVEALLSSNSRKKINGIVASFAAMDGRQREALAGRLGIDAGRLSQMTVTEYLSLQFSQGDKLGADIYRDIVTHTIIGTERKDERAVVKVSNGMEVVFVKEGPYWKLDLSDY